MSCLRLLKNFQFSHLGDYIKRFPYYARGISYYRYVDKLKKNGVSYGIVKGTNEQYIFDIDDKCIPYEMYRSQKTYSQGDIEVFLDLVKKIYQKKITENREGKFLDIGANIGTTSIYIAQNIDPKMHIFAFEPDRLNFQILKANCSINGCANIQPVNIALSDRTGSKKMMVNETNRANSKLLTDQCSECGESGKNRESIEDVKTYRLDDWLKAQNISGEEIAYIWMDIEGHEAYAVEGMMELLATYKPPFFMEFTAKNNEYVTVSEEEFQSLYKNLGRVYQKVIIPKLDKDCKKEFPIEYLKELYYNTNEQYNIFLL